MPVTSLILDFDGVILDSLEVKTRAFYEMYLPYGENFANAAVKYHLEHGGVSRVKKFQYFEKEFFGRVLNESELNELVLEFGRRVVQAVIESNEVAGVRNFLKAYCKKYKIFVISGTPEDELKYVVEKAGLQSYFLEVFGSPNSKDFWVKKIISDYGLNPSEMVFIGDATTDQDAAELNHLHFVLREHPAIMHLFEGKDLARIKDFVGFEEFLREKFA